MKFGDTFRLASEAMGRAFGVSRDKPTFFVGVRDSDRRIIFNDNMKWGDSEHQAWLSTNGLWSLLSMNHPSALVGTEVHYGDFVIVRSEKFGKDLGQAGIVNRGDEDWNGNTRKGVRILCPDKTVGEPVAFGDRVILRFLWGTAGGNDHNHSLRIYNEDPNTYASG